MVVHQAQNGMAQVLRKQKRRRLNPQGVVCEGKADFTMSFRLKDFFSAFGRCFWDRATLSLVERR
jgi:hypothetical protein